jgi:rhodanese-related sulfurtransferase
VTLLVSWASTTRAPGQRKATVNQTTLEEAGQLTPEISTEELKKILTTRSEPVLDVRSATEYAIAHIPGSINVYEKEVESLIQIFPENKAGYYYWDRGRPRPHVTGA